MNFLTTVLTLLCLGACGPTQSANDPSGYGLGWGQNRRVAHDVEAIQRGIDQARAENERLARAARDPAIARPGS